MSFFADFRSWIAPCSPKKYEEISTYSFSAALGNYYALEEGIDCSIEELFGDIKKATLKTPFYFIQVIQSIFDASIEVVSGASNFIHKLGTIESDQEFIAFAKECARNGTIEVLKYTLLCGIYAVEGARVVSGNIANGNLTEVFKSSIGISKNIIEFGAHNIEAYIAYAQSQIAQEELDDEFEVLVYQEFDDKDGVVYLFEEDEKLAGPTNFLDLEHNGNEFVVSREENVETMGGVLCAEI